MNLKLARFAYTPTETQGKLYAGGQSWFTIERPWIRWHSPGGEPFKSCVPDGEYELVPFERPNGDKVFALINETLGVYLNDSDRQKNGHGERLGRYLILIHVGNYVDDVVGCIAPGKNRTIHDNRMMVTLSRMSMSELIDTVGWKAGHQLTIRQAPGAVE